MAKYTERAVVTLPADLSDWLWAAAKERGCSRADLLRRAVALLRFALEAEASGRYVGVADSPSVLRSRLSLMDVI